MTSRPQPLVDAMQKEIQAQKAIMQEQETSIDQLRTENMNLRAKLAQKKKKKTPARKGGPRGR